MDPLTAKQQEIQDRESRILSVARPIIVHEGYHGLKMDRIADALEYSKGTIYNHFSCKEEIIIALATQNAAKRVDMFRQAAQFKGVPRFRMLAICEAAERFVRTFPDYFLFEQILNLDSVREKTSQKRQDMMHGCELQCMNVVAGIVRDAIANDHLTLPADMTPERLVFGLWSLTSGAYAIVFTSSSLPHMGIEDPYSVIRKHVCALLDGYQWLPLTKQFDVAEVLAEIRAAIDTNRVTL